MWTSDSAVKGKQAANVVRANLDRCMALMKVLEASGARLYRDRMRIMNVMILHWNRSDELRRWNEGGKGLKGERVEVDKT